jgi:hypothetical protein
VPKCQSAKVLRPMFAIDLNAHWFTTYQARTSHRTLAPWHPGTLAPWHLGTLAPWHLGTFGTY